MDSEPRRELIDAVMDGYVAWRESSAGVAVAYERFRHAVADGRRLAYATYLAALDQEEGAAAEYRRCLDLATGECRPGRHAAPRG